MERAAEKRPLLYFAAMTKGNASVGATPTVLIAGFGDIGERVARLLSSSHQVTALVRNPDRYAAVKDARAQPLAGDLDDVASLGAIAGLAATVFHFAPPPNSGADDPRTANLLSALSSGVLPKQVVYISTTGVYGDCSGTWIDESTEVNPVSERGQRRVAAEQRLTAWAREKGVKLAILRAPGIYAASRLPLERIRARTPVIVAEEDSWSNHIHADDLARAAVSAYAFLAGGGAGLELLVLNVVDDSQLKMGDYFDLVADHFKLERPPRVSRAEAESRVSTAMLSFMRESRRIRNDHLKTVLRFSLNYPTVGHFLAALAESDPSNCGETRPR